MSGLAGLNSHAVFNWNTRVLRAGSYQTDLGRGSELLGSPLRPAKAQKFEELWQEKCARL